MVEYGPDVTSTAYALGTRSDFACGGDGGNFFSFASNAFNDVLTGATCLSRKLDGYTTGAPFNTTVVGVGQDFGAGNEKHIRKIRYQNIYNISKIDVRAGNFSESWFSGTLILNAYPVVQEDTGWNEILLPFSQPYRYWGIKLNSVGSYGSYVRCAFGEIEMMEAIPRVGASVFFL